MSYRALRGSFGLSPMQAGMLFQALYNPGKGLDIEQLVCRIPSISNEALKFAWGCVWDINDVLRTEFNWRDVDSPVQNIYQDIPLPWRELDWSDLEDNPQDLLKEFLFQDRKAGFSLDEAPLMRLTLIHARENFTWLVWTYHHILLDGRSLPIIMKQLAEAYQLYGEGSEVTLTPTRSYQDYISWLEQQDWTDAKAYWKKRLEGIQSSTPVGISFPQTHLPDEPDYQILKSYLPANLTSRLEKFVSKYSLTLNTLLQGAWAILLSRYSGERDILFGAIRTGRYSALNGQNTANMVGLLINTLPMRVMINPEAEVLDVFKDLRTQTIQLRDSLQEHLSLIEIQKLTNLKSDTHLFESIVAFDHLDYAEMIKKQHPLLEKWEFELLEHAGYPLVVTAYAGKQLKICLEYNRYLFDDETAKRILEHLHALLQAIIEHPSCPTYQLEFLTQTELDKLLSKWNSTRTEYPKDQSIHTLFEEQVTKTPAAVAVTFENQQLTYQELNQKANQLAHHLLQLGLKREDRVGIYLERSLDMIIGLLAILKAGGAYVPLDPTYPKERIEFILEDTQVSVLLTYAELWQHLNLANKDLQLVVLNQVWSEITHCKTSNLDQQINANHLAYIMYTSGSTGKPKGSAIPHRGVVRLVRGANYLHFGENETFLQLAPLSFDASTLEIWGPLLNGGRLVIFPAHLPTLDELGEALCKYDISTLWLTAGLFHQMVDTQLPALRHVRQLLAGGDVLSPAHVRLVLEGLPEGSVLVNGYGPTENTTFTCCYPMTSAEQIGRSVPIGRPISNTYVYILDKYQQLVPIGVAGELYIGGDGLARQYWNQPELTSERFVPDPFSTNPDSRLYKTGDLARYLPDGNIEFLGREDFQVKIRGYRVELGEVENCLISHPGIQSAVILTRLDTSGNKQLVAYLVPEPAYIEQKKQVHAADLREFLKSRLPDYMIPAAFIPMESFPLTSNGKIDRKALARVAVSLSEVETSAIAQTPTEEKLLKIWADILAVQPIGIHDNFFELGGHSLLATRLLVHIRQELGVDLPLRSLFETPTVAELAKQVENLLWASAQKNQNVNDLTDTLEDLFI